MAETQKERALQAAQRVLALRAQRDELDTKLAAAEREFSELVPEHEVNGVGGTRRPIMGRGVQAAHLGRHGRRKAAPVTRAPDEPIETADASLRTRILQFIAGDAKAKDEIIAAMAPANEKSVMMAVYDMSSKRRWIDRVLPGVWKLNDAGRARLTALASA